VAEEINVTVRMQLAEDLAEEFRAQFEVVQEIINKTKLTLNLNSDDKFLKNLRKTFNDTLAVVKQIRDELTGGIKIKLEINDQFTADIEKQLRGAMQEALNRVLPDAKKIGQAIGDEAAKSVDKTTQRAKSKAQQSAGGGVETERQRAQTVAPGGRVDRVAVGAELVEELERVQLELTQKRSEFASILGGLAVTFNDSTEKIEAGLRQGGRGISDAVSSLSSKAARNVSRDLRPTIDSLINMVGEVQRLESRFRTLSGEEIKFDDLTPGIKAVVGQSEDLLRLLNQIGRASDQQLRLYDRRLRDTAQTTQFLEESTLKFAQAIRSGDASELEAINVQHRSLGQKLSREVISLKEQQQLYGSIGSLAEELADELRVVMGSGDLSDGVLQDIQGQLKIYERITEDAQRRIAILKEEEKVTSKQRQQVEAASKKNRAQIRIIEERNRINEAALRQSTQLVLRTQQQTSEARKLVKAYRELDQGEVLDAGQLDRAKRSVSDLNKSFRDLERNLHDTQRAGRDAARDLEKQWKNRTGPFDNLTGPEARAQYSKLLAETDQNNKRREALIKGSMQRIKTELESIDQAGLGRGIIDAEEVLKARNSAQGLGKDFEILNERVRALGTRGASSELEDLDINMKAVRTQQQSLVREMDQQLAKLRELANRGLITNKSYQEQASSLRALRSEAAALSNTDAFKGLRQQAQGADVVRFLRDEFEGVQIPLDRFNDQLQINQRLLAQGPAGTIAAAQGFKRLGNEVGTLQARLADIQLSYAAATRRGTEFTAAERAQIKEVDRLATSLANTQAQLKRQEAFLKQAETGAKRAGLGWRLYNQELANSIINNARFINSMTIITSALFLLRRGLFDVIEESRAFARTMTVLQSQTLTLAEAFDKFRAAARNTAVEFGVAITEVSEVVKQFGSAGLTAEESLGALNDAMRVIISTSADAEEVTRTIAGLYNVFGNDLREVGDEFAAFGVIADTLTSIYRNHQAELDEVTQGFRFAAATGRAAGFQFQEIGAFLAVLNDNLIKSGAAGRGLQVVFAQLANKVPQLADSLGIALDPNRSLNEQFLGFLREVNNQIGTGSITVEALSRQFQLFGLRGARSAVTLAQNFGEVEEALEELGDARGTASELAEIVQSQLANSFERAKQALLELVRDSIEPLKRFFLVISDVILQIRDGFRFFEAIGGTSIGAVVLAIGAAVAVFQSLVAVMQVMLVIVKGLTISYTPLVAAKQADTAASVENTAVIVAEGVAKKNLEKTNIQAAGSYTLLAGGISKTHGAIALLLTLLPLIVFGFGKMNTTVAEVRSELQGLEAEFGRLNRARRDLAKFEREFSKVADKINGGTLGVEASARLLRNTVDTLGAAFVNTFEINSTASDRLINNFARVEKSIRSQIRAQEELQDARERAARAREIRENRRLLDEQFPTGTFASIENRLESEDTTFVSGLIARREAVEDLIDVFSGTKATNAANLATLIFSGRSPEFTGRAAEGLGVSIADIKLIQEFIDESEGLYDRLFSENAAQGLRIALRDFNAQVDREFQIASADFQAVAKLAFRGDQESILDAAAKQVTNGKVTKFSQLEGHLKKQAEEFSGVVTDNFISEVARLNTGVVDPFETVVVNQEEVFRNLQTSIDQVTYDRWIDEVRKASTAAQDTRIQIQNLIKAQATGLDVQVPRAALTSMLAPRLQLFDARSLNELADSLASNFDGTIPLAIDEDQIAGQLSQVFNSADFAKLLPPEKVEEYKNQIRDANRRGVIEGFINTITDYDLADEFGRVYADAGDLALIFAGIVDKLGDSQIETQNLIDELVNLSQVDLFAASARSVAALTADTTVAQSERRKIQNSRAQIVDQLIKAQQIEGALTQERTEEGIKQLSIQEKLKKLKEEEVELSGSLALEAARQVGAPQDASIDEEQSEEIQQRLKLLLSENERIGEIREQTKFLLDNDVERVKTLQKLSAVDTKNLNEARKLLRESKSLSLELTGQFAIEQDKLEALELQREARELELRATGELTAEGLNGLAARTELAEIDKQILEQRRATIGAAAEEVILRDVLISQGEKLLDRQNKFAGLGREANAVFREIARVEEDIAKSISDQNAGLLDTKKFRSQITEQVQRLLDFSEEAFDIQDRLKDLYEDQNEILALRISILKNINDVFSTEQEKIASDLSEALGLAFEADKIRTAVVVARELGVSLNQALNNFDGLKETLIEGFRQGTVSTAAFGSRVSGIASQFLGVQNEIDGVQLRLRALQDTQIDRFTKAFEEAFSKKKIDDARQALSSLQSVINDRFANDPTRRIDELENLETMAQRLQEIQDERNNILLKIDFDLSAFDVLEDRIEKLIQGLRDIQSTGAAFIPGLGEIRIIADPSEISNTIRTSINEGFRLIDSDLRVPGFQTGGRIPGFGGGDIVPALLEPGEFVIPKEAVSKFGTSVFETMRRGQVPRFQDGGLVGSFDFGKYKDSGIVPESFYRRANEDATSNAKFAARRQFSFGDFLKEDAATVRNIFDVLNNRWPEHTAFDSDLVLKLAETPFTIGRKYSLTSKRSLLQENFARLNEKIDSSVEDADLASFIKTINRVGTGTALDYVNPDKESDIAKFVDSSQSIHQAFLDTIQESYPNISDTAFDLAVEAMDTPVGIVRQPLTSQSLRAIDENFVRAQQTIEEVAKLRSSGFGGVLRTISGMAGIAGFQTGGHIPGFGGGDIVPALLEPGEFVIPKEAVKALGANYFEQFRRGATGFQTGGQVGGRSNPGVIPTQAQTQARSLDLFDNPKVRKAVEDLAKAHADQLEKEFGNKDFIKGFANNLAEAFETAVDFVSGFFNIDFVLEGAAAVGEALDTYTEALQEIDQSFQETVSEAETQLSRNASDFLSFIDTIQDAELERYAARAEAERELRAEIEETQTLFTQQLVGNISEGVGLLQGAIGSINADFDFGKSVQNVQATSNAVGLARLSEAGAQQEVKLSKDTVKGMEAFTDGLGLFNDEAYAEAQEEAWRALEGATAAGKALEEARQANAKTTGDLIGGAAVNILKGAGGLILGGLQKALSFLANPEALKNAIKGFETFVNRFTENGGEVVSDLVQDIVGLVEVIVEALPVIFEVLMRELPVLVQGLVDTLVEALPKIITTLVDGLPDLIRGLIPAIFDLVNALIDNLPALLEGLIVGLFVFLVEFWKQLPKLIWNIIKAIPKLIVAWISGIFRGIGEALGSIFKPFLKIADSIKEAFDTAIGWINDIFEKIASIFEKLTPEQKADRDTARRTSDLGGREGNLQGGVLGYNPSRNQLRKLAKKAARIKKKEGVQTMFTPEEVAELKDIFPKDAKIQTLREGGFIPGYGGGDIVPALLEPGEFVIPKEVVSMLGGPNFFEALRTQQFERFRDGGIVGGTGGFSRGSFAGTFNAMTQTNNISLAVSGAATTEQNRQTADELVEFIDEGLERRQRNRNLRLST
jgi:TP901 family phage tail tape measure protein